MGQGVGGTKPVLPHTDDPWVSLMQGKGLIAPTRQLSTEESKSGEPDSTGGKKQYTPAGFNLFEKPCPRLWTNLGKGRLAHRKPEHIFKIWQLEVAT